MDVLIIGLSSIVQRRVLPALDSIADVSTIDISSRSKNPDVAKTKPGKIFRDHDQAIAESDADMLYISLPNSDHLPWIMKGLEAGKHVIVDKPATLTLKDAELCCSEAARRNLLIAEATVFSYHSQFHDLIDFFREHGPLTHISAHFIIPPLPAENFRNFQRLGGGCLHDMGPYAAAIARIFSDKPPDDLCAANAPADAVLDIDTGFSFLARFPSGLRYTGHFSFEGEYQNNLVVVGKRGSVSIERIFSAPAGADAIWQVRRQNAATTETKNPSDSFRMFLEAVISALPKQDLEPFRRDLIQDATFRDRIHQSLNNRTA